MKQILIVELVGVAGAGKTTLGTELSKNNERIILNDHPYFRRIDHFPFFVWNSFLMIPTFLKLFKSCGVKTFPPREMAWMVILNGWHRMLRRQVLDGKTIIVLDQGPISMLAQLFVLHPDLLNYPAAREWWDRMLSIWSQTLDLLVWIDTSDTTLIKRVMNRSNFNIIKTLSDQEALALNARFRSLYHQLVSDFSSREGGPQKMDFDSGICSTNMMMEKVLVILGIENHTRAESKDSPVAVSDTGYTLSR